MSMNGRTVQSVEIACEILIALRDLNGARLTELADELGYAKSAIHGQLSTLYQQEFIIKDADNAYHLSLLMVDLAEYVKNNIKQFDVIKSEVHEVAAETDEVAQFATEEHGRAVYIYKENGEQGVETESRIGMRTHLHSTALGKAMLSQLDEDTIRQKVLRHGLIARTNQTTTDVKTLLDRVEETRKRGYAVDNEENVPGIRCVAAPVLKDNEELLGALSITGPKSRMSDERIENELRETISRAANVVELNYKFAE